MRAIIMTGTARSGTSMLAHIVFRLGVKHCDHLIGPHHQHNPDGHFECRQWHDLNRGVIKAGCMTPDALRGIRELITSHQEEPVWGVKDPAFLYTLGHVVRLIDDVRVVAIHRSFGAVVRSKMAHAGETHQEATERELRARMRLLMQLVSVSCPVLHVNYEELIDDPRAVTTELAEFVFDGLGIEPQIAPAAAVVKPELNRSGVC